jgi:type VI protein secretion system component Hcp
MNTLSDAANEETNGKKMGFNRKEYALMTQNKIINEFFQTDGCGEMVGSLNRMIEDFLFTENLSQVTPEMREHIANNLRVATLVAKLGDCHARCN